MVQLATVNGVRSVRSPHARGDGPLREVDMLWLVVFSPRPWGWSGNIPLVTLG